MVTAGRRGSRCLLLVGALQRSRSAGVEFLPLLAPARLGSRRAPLERGSAAPAPSATHVPACTPRMRTALPSRAAAARESSDWKRHPSQVLLPPPRREEAEPSPLHPSLLCRRGANACRTGHAFVTLQPLSRLPHESGRTRERHRVRLAVTTTHV